MKRNTAHTCQADFCETCCLSGQPRRGCSASSDGLRSARPDDPAAGLVYDAAPRAYRSVAGSEAAARTALAQLWRARGHSAGFEHALVAEVDGTVAGVLIGFAARDRYRLHTVLLFKG